LPVSSNLKTAKAFPAKNLFNNVINVSSNMMNKRFLNFMKCKAAKKYKTSALNITIVWKLCTSEFSFE